MTLAPETDWRAARRQDRREEREQDRIDRQFNAQLSRENKLSDRATEREEKEKKAAAKAKAKRERATAWRQRRRTVRDNWDVAIAIIVMACGMFPALVFQHRSLVDMKMDAYGLAILLPIMLELSAWASTAGEVKALREHRNATPYRVGVWVFTALAAGVNAWHGAKDYGIGGAVILAATSIGPVAILHMIMAGRHGAKARRTKAEIAAAKRAKADAKAREEHLKNRRRDHAQAAALADHMLSAAPFGDLDPEDAFRQACEILHGSTNPGMTPELYAMAASSRVRLAAAFEMAPDENERIRTSLLEGLYGPAKKAAPVLGVVSALRKKTPKIAQVTAQIPQAEQRGERKRPTPPRRRKGDTPKYHDAARLAARETALRTEQ